MKKLASVLLVVTMVFGLVACGLQQKNKENNKGNNKDKAAQMKIEELVPEEEQTEQEVQEVEEVETVAEEEPASEETNKVTPSEQKKTTNVTTKPTTKPTTNSATKPVTQPVEAPTEPEVKPEECEHNYECEYKEYDAIKHYIYGCNGCGYPLFTIEGVDAVNLPNLYSHPACYSEKLGMDCNGGGFHSEVYYQGYCGACHDEIQLRSCMFTEMGKRCVKNEALGAYEKVEYGQNLNAYLKSCECGQNILLKDGATGKGLMVLKETCRYCGEVKTYPEK